LGPGIRGYVKDVAQRDPMPSSAGTEVQLFDRDDEGYLQWVLSNAGGFVLNFPRRGSDGTLVHRASCRTLTEASARGESWTAEYLKLCSGQTWRLDDWAEQELGFEPARCQACSPD
jgi:hypothetical protein